MFDRETFHKRITFQRRRRRLAVATAAGNVLGRPERRPDVAPFPPADVKPEIRFESDFRINPVEFVASGLIPIWMGEA